MSAGTALLTLPDGKFAGRLYALAGVAARLVLALSFKRQLSPWNTVVCLHVALLSDGYLNGIVQLLVGGQLIVSC